MAKKSAKKQVVKEWHLSVVDPETCSSWFDDVKGKLEFHRAENIESDDQTGKPSPISINSVPNYLMSLNRDAYVPRVVRLGLFHRRISQPLSQMELYKINAVNRTVKRLPREQQHARFLVERVQNLLPKLTESYEVKVDRDPEILAWAFTLDGCFILETLRLLSDETQWDLNVESQWKLDPVFNRNRVRSCQFDILSDILMLENQVPIILLIELLAMEHRSTVEAARIELLRMICDGIIALVHPFNYYLQPSAKEQQTQHRDREMKMTKVFESKYKNLAEYNHILGFFHDFVVDECTHAEKTGDVQITVPRHRRRRHRGHPREKAVRQSENQTHRKQMMASAAELYRNGMKFRWYKGVPSADHLRFVKKDKTLFLPVIYVSDTTEVILRNLMAIDVCQEKDLSIISEYVFLMNGFVQAEEDVVLLRKKGIIQSSIGTDKEVTDLFNGLSRGVNFSFADEDEFGQFKIDVNEWYRRRTMVQIGEFMEKHPKFMRTFTMFWGVVLVVAAAVPTMVQIFKQIYANAK